MKIINLLETLKRNDSALEERLGVVVNKSAVDDRWRDVYWVSAYNKSLIHTPIGYIGCNAISHILYSAICAVLILGMYASVPPSMTYD